MSDQKTLTVIIPAFNEAANLELLLPQLMEFCSKLGFMIIIVDDGSRDNTREVLSRFSDQPRINLLHHKMNRGYGAAIKTGISACSTEYAITFDADGQHVIEDIERLYNRMVQQDADLVVGSRQGLKNSSYRGFGRTLIRLIAKILMNVPVHDLNSGMKIYRTDLLKKYFHLAPDNMSYSDIITLVFLNNRHLVLEEPISIRARKQGRSSITLETAFHTVMEIINIVTLFNPMKIFLPISLLCILTTAAWGIPLLIQGRGVSMGTFLGIISGLIFFLLGLLAEQLSQIRKGISH
ncbi:MAG: glycosyltransferase family 2 protein [Bacteroidota bacterium]|jgi:glycosyltransferase involved in cell wall biosynthesis